MNNFLQHLVERSLGAEAQPVQPRLPGLFEPITGAGPNSVEPPEREAEEETRPRRMAPPVEAVRETVLPGAMPLRSPPGFEEHPAARSPAPKPEPQISNRPVIEPVGEGQLEERPSALQPAERVALPQPKGRIEPRPAPERQLDRDPTTINEPKPEPLRPAPAHEVVRPQLEETQHLASLAFLDSPRDRERPRAAPIEPAMRLRRDEPRIARDGDEIIPAVEPPAPPILPQPKPAPIEQPTIPRVQVNIGRVEVRAIFAPPPAKAPVRPQPEPSMSLDDYLKQRDGGS